MEIKIFSETRVPFHPLEEYMALSGTNTAHRKEFHEFIYLGT